jgi:glucosyl-dolichyl phosphate glucuronosyltransferase
VKYSFLICSHQAPTTLTKTLDSIFVGGSEFEYEIVLINNGFPLKREIALQEGWAGDKQKLRIIQETQPGLGPARCSAFRQAKGDYLILLDDDNTVEQNFLQALERCIAEANFPGGICGAVVPVWEKEPPLWVRDFGRSCLSYNTCGTLKPPFEKKQWLPQDAEPIFRPPGGGMIIHRSVATLYLEQITDTKKMERGRRGNSLGGCEDADIYDCVCLTGLSAVFDSGVKIFHHIPTKRVRFAYLWKLNLAMTIDYGRRQVSENEKFHKKNWHWLKEMLLSWKQEVSLFINGQKRLPHILLDGLRSWGLMWGRCFAKVE